MKTLLTIMAHAEAQATFDRHLPYWQLQSEKDYIMAMCPQDSVVRTDLSVLAIGGKCHHGPASIMRFRKLLHFLTKTNFDWHIIHEYDSISLPHPSIVNYVKPDSHFLTIYSNLFTADQPEFKGHHFLHPPLSMSVEVLREIVNQSAFVPDEAEQGFWDRWLGYVCELAGVNMKGYGDAGFSRNTIEPHDMAAAVAARKAGAVMFHGVKSEQVLKALVSV